MSDDRASSAATNVERHHVTYGPWERNDDVRPGIGPSYGFGGRFLGMRVFHAMRRKVYETWWEDGQKMGRCKWQDGGVS